jgi:hypothetical protein
VGILSVDADQRITECRDEIYLVDLFILFYFIHGKPTNRKVETSVKKVRHSDGATQGSKLPLTRLPKKNEHIVIKQRDKS